MRILALDLGIKRIGVALSDHEKKIAFPLRTINVQSNHQIISDIQELINEYDVSEIVIGVPYNLQNLKTEQTRSTEQSIDIIKKNIPVDIKILDERLTTKEADKIMLLGKASRKKRREKKDQIAAALILQSYLQSQKY